MAAGPAEFLGAGLLVFLMCMLAGAGIFIPYGFVALGWLRLGDYRKHELEALPDDNTVGDPEAGERKYQEWLSAMNSSEAFLGMIPRSAPYVPPDERAPDNARLPRMRLNAVGLACVAATALIGSLFGVYVAAQYGVGVRGGDAVVRNVNALQVICAGLMGALFALPFGYVVALIVGRVEVQEDTDDARGSGPETA